ncbi:MAG: hypothetical protein KatS3mg060_3226 [Dehalococcoidia bacterium]|nr:MAG: hypothetical protein KatS3mg060_3226 [Dehalococcoidia bacterium]
MPPDLDAPDYLRIEVDLLDRRTGSTVQSERGLITVGPLRVTGGTWPPPGMERAALEGENALRLDGLRIEQYAPERPESGGSLALLPAWTAATSARSATARITVLDATGAVVTVADRGLGTWHEIRNWRAGDRFVDELDLDLPAGLPSGDYRLQLAIRVDGREAIGIVGTVRR